MFSVTLSLTMIFKQHQLVSLKIRVCDNSHSKLHTDVRFVAHTIYMMHSMLNYSHSNPVDTHLKKLVESILKPPFLLMPCIKLGRVK